MFSIKNVLALLLLSLFVVGCNTRNFVADYDLNKEYKVSNWQDFSDESSDKTKK